MQTMNGDKCSVQRSAACVTLMPPVCQSISVKAASGHGDTLWCVGVKRPHPAHATSAHAHWQSQDPEECYGQRGGCTRRRLVQPTSRQDGTP